MNKKGFTLIELLAVIVILAVIALIATPIILGIIDDARKGAFEESARNTVKAAEHYYATSNLKSIDAEGVCYVFNYSSDVTEKTLIEEGLYQIPVSELDLSGKKVTDGKVTVCGTYSEAELSDGAYTYVLRRTGAEQILKGSLTENDLSEPIIDSIEYEIISGTSIKVNVTAHEEDAGEISKYYYSIDGINYTESSEAEYTIEDLTLNTEYKVYVQVSNKSGLKASGTKDVIIVCAYEPGQTWEYNYVTKATQQFPVPCTGTYKLEVWGAKGGSLTYAVSAQGGKGGYSYGSIDLVKDQTLFIAVGGKPNDIAARQDSKTNYTSSAGYNGGASSTSLGITSGTGYAGGGGGGATHIALVDGTLAAIGKTEAVTNKKVLIVAGGGGGAGGKYGWYGTNYEWKTEATTGGTGGGTNGGAGTGTGSLKGGGATQTAGGAPGNANYGGPGTFGQGYSNSGNWGGGGGGGLYGGGAGWSGQSGGGGSGYLSSLLRETGTSNGVNADAGKAKITLVSY